MAQRYTEDVYTECPFYMKETKNRLICEGIPENSSTSTVFGSIISKAKYQDRYCRKNYNACGLCKALMDKYA